MIETVKRFHCPRCGYITEDEVRIAHIEKSKLGYCPACGDGKPKVWERRTKGEGLSTRTPLIDPEHRGTILQGRKEGQ